MDVSKERIQQHLRDFSIRRLFVEEFLWDRLKEPPLAVVVETQVYRLHAVAEKSGVKVYVCDPDALGRIPADTVLRRIEREVTKSAFEHILVYHDVAHQSQVWQWVKRERGKSAVPRYSRLYKGQSGELLAQKLMHLVFTIEEEPGVSEVGQRLSQAFDTERVTRKFYERFQKELVAFQGFIDGIMTQGDREWYASLMLNRLMFIYFIQKKGFLNATSDDGLNGERDYLRTRLERVQATYGQDEFHSFYRFFLLNLFSDLNTQMGKRTRSSQLDTLLGRIPYLNGGLFDVHALEQDNPNIRIPDAAFEHIFDFFDEFDWHLDDRPLRNDREVNPDVLGYIFEKYINQKQMGAYYTKEDITEYISKNTIIPFLFEATKNDCEIAFVPDGPVWSLLRDNPDDYIYEAMAKGANLPLPIEIEVGLHDIAQRGEWNKPAPKEFALPMEIWREVVARRQRYEEVHAKLANGEITTINDLITYNLDICRFAQDVITYCEGTDLLNAFYKHIRKVTVLDPTCGSGAFLFAALNILKPLYEACLIRMQVKVDEREQLDAHIEPKYRRAAPDITTFREILQEVAPHHNRDYFILKSIIINNLYGVDIMEEATEICKLRLFLKLVSQVERFRDIEPLPDIDFNIRAGNTLIGFASYQETKESIARQEEGRNAYQLKMDFSNTAERIEQKAQQVERDFQDFRTLQTYASNADLAQSKKKLRQHLSTLESELNKYLSIEYGYEKGREQWTKASQPFHWWVEFYGIIEKRGGFDVVIGNPPYVEYSKVKKDYVVKHYKTESCGNLYAFCIERFSALTNSASIFGQIIPLSIVCTSRMAPIRDILYASYAHIWLDNYDTIPGTLFSGIVQRNTVILATKLENGMARSMFTTKNQKWYVGEREHLFHSVPFERFYASDANELIPKVSTALESSIVTKVSTQKAALVGYMRARSNNTFMYKRRWSYFLLFADSIANILLPDGSTRVQQDNKVVALSPEVDRYVFIALLSSGLFYFHYSVYSDFRHVNVSDFEHFRFDYSKLTHDAETSLSKLGTLLMQSYTENLEWRQCNYKGSIGECEVPFYRQGASKPIIDEIDRVLAQHYDFTDEELDFIINYDIKYRIGKQDDDANDDE